MTASTRSSVTRYQPAILALLGATVAYAAWCVYSSVTRAPPSNLRRSNAVRRGNPRLRRSSASDRIVRLFRQPDILLGEVDIFGTQVVLDARNMISEDSVRNLAHNSDPPVGPEDVDRRLTELYDVTVARLLERGGRPLSVVETDAITRFLADWIPNEGLGQALQRHRQAITGGATVSDLAAPRAESIGPTEVSWASDEDTEGGAVDAAGQLLQRTLYHIAEERAK
jgi:hypothetical protein